ncbi:MAG TPA: hypothetical protein VKV80_01350 [Streptosporangiaceae bacterium]|nr:hypothetical protein [Streptosporangiaceae bacterium]
MTTSAHGPWPVNHAVTLDDLDRRWGEPCDLAASAGIWLARRLGDGAPLTASSPEELRKLIAAGYATRPETPARPRRGTRRGTR